MEKFTTGYCQDLSYGNNTEQTIFEEFTFGLDLEGIDISDTIAITCPHCRKNNYFYTTQQTYCNYVCVYCKRIIV